MDISMEVGHVMQNRSKQGNPYSGILSFGFGIQLFGKSEILLMTRIRNPRSTDKESRIQYNPKRACVLLAD